MIFNIVVDAVVRALLDMIWGTQEAQNGLVWAAGVRNLVFYVNNGRIAGQYHKWVEDELTVTVAVFHRMGLNTNLEKTKSIVFTACFVWWK